MLQRHGTESLSKHVHYGIKNECLLLQQNCGVVQSHHVAINVLNCFYQTVADHRCPRDGVRNDPRDRRSNYSDIIHANAKTLNGATDTFSTTAPTYRANSTCCHHCNHARVHRGADQPRRMGSQKRQANAQLRLQRHGKTHIIPNKTAALWHINQPLSSIAVVITR